METLTLAINRETSFFLLDASTIDEFAKIIHLIARHANKGENERMEKESLYLGIKKKSKPADADDGKRLDCTL